MIILKKRIWTTVIGMLLLFSILISGVACNQGATENESATEKKTVATESKTDATESKTDATESKADTTESKTDATESKADTTESKTDATEEKTEETETEIPEINYGVPSQEVTVLSQNLLCDEHTVSKRAPAMINSIRALKPDSFGVQECIKAWAKRLDVDLKDYARVGVDCMGNESGEFSTYIYYLKNKYKVIASSTFWMSNTPDVPSQFNDHVNVMNRTCTWAILENKETGFRYVHVNCHLDWADQSANLVQTQMIRNLILRFEAMGYPVFATGDYNAKEGTDSYQAMLTAASIADARYLSERTTDVVSHYGNKSSVDFCFVTKDKMQVLQFDIIHNVREEVEVSDHNGVYVRAKVQSLPLQDHSKTSVAFSDGAKITAVKDPRYGALMSVTFTQAMSLENSVAASYNVVIHDQSGNEFYAATVYGGQYCATQSAEVNFKLSDGVPGQIYTIEITPVSIFGEKGAPISQAMEWVADPNAPMPPSAPDIIDISVANGVVIDSTQNGYKITQIGDVTITDDSMVFNREGNIRTSSIADQYGKMIDGFTMEAVITTGNDLNPIGHFASNLHAGGFGLYTQKGLLHFVVHNGKEYVAVSCTVEKNTTYHVVGVFNGNALTLYVNGEKMNSVEFSGAMKLPTVVKAEYLCIGGDVDATGNGENMSQCTVYKIAIYSNILTDNEIAALYLIK